VTELRSETTFIRKMEALQQVALDRLQDGTRVIVTHVETLLTMWVRLEKWPKMTNRLTWIMKSRPKSYLPKKGTLTLGMLVAVQSKMGNLCLWERALLLRKTDTGYIVLLIDWGIEVPQDINTIRLLPSKFAKMPTWAKKINLRGIRAIDQSEESLQPEVARLILQKRRGCLMNIEHSSEEGITARFLLDCPLGQDQVDVAAHWLELDYVVPK
jgi:hypothetical protein